MPAKLLRALPSLLPVVVVLAGLALLLLDPVPMLTLRYLLFDQYQRWQPRAYTEAPVRIIDIDDASLARHGQWPWPRTRLAELVDRLSAAGVAAIGFDMMFPEADRSSPSIAAATWPLSAGLRTELGKLPDHDQMFAEHLAKADVVLGLSVEAVTPGPPPQVDLARPYRYIYSGVPAGNALHQFNAAVSSLPVLQKAAKGHGAMTFISDNDGVVRRVPMIVAVGGTPTATLTAETLRVGQGARNYIVKAAEGRDTGLAEIRIGDYVVPTNNRGELWLHYSAPRAERYIPAWRVLAGGLPDALLQGRLVLIGTSAKGLLDMRLNPLGRVMPGVEAHAQALEQILTGHFLRRPAWARAAEAIVLACGGLALGWLAWRTRALLGAALTLATLALVLWGGWYAYSRHGLLLDSLTPALVMTLAFVLGSLAHHMISERRQRWIKQAFSRYVSPNLVEHLVGQPDQLELGGKRQECSFVFTDLAGYTSLMESIDPAEAVCLLNTYLDGMIAIAFRHHGTLDRIVGDAVAIMFSAPVAQPDHKARALACAMEMDAYASGYAADLQARGIGFGQTRIGVHSGEVIVGNFGGSTIFDYRALGDPVNTAARLESVNKHLGTQVCVSEATLAGCPDAETRPVGRLVLKGKHQAISVFEPISAANRELYAPIDDYRAAYACLALDPTGTGLADPALMRFRDLAGAYPADPLVALHLRRIEAGEHGDLIVMSEK
jgi:adenylate cyclase